MSDETATPEQWRAAYEAKVEDLARETRRVSVLVAALQFEGHRGSQLPHRWCRLCQALVDVGVAE